MPVLTRVRSLLFMPGTRADMIAKIARIEPDVAAVDLEDAVAPADKETARAPAVAAIGALDPDAFDPADHRVAGYGRTCASVRSGEHGAS